MDWATADYKIDQRKDPPITVSGAICRGVGVHYYGAELYAITHLKSGLLIMPVWASSLDEAKVYAERVLALNDWEFASKDEISEDDFAILQSGVREIVKDMEHAWDNHTIP